jgi:protein TonB
MSAVLNFAGLPLMYSQYSDKQEDTPLHQRISVVGVVVLLHLAVFVAYLFQPEAPAVLINEMSVSIANLNMPQAQVTPPQPKPREIEPEPLPVEEPEVKEEAPPPPVQQASPPSPVQLDTEPDFKADYLNNPRPPYPMVARRMGYSGKVVLNVEVLAAGKAGEVKLEKSSGYDILDSAALQTVKTWRFTPAKRFGQAVTQWFLVPIKFSLKEDEA